MLVLIAIVFPLILTQGCARKRAPLHELCRISHISIRFYYAGLPHSSQMRVLTVCPLAASYSTSQKKRPQVMPFNSYILRCLTATFPTKIFVDPHTIATSVTLFPSSRIASTRMVTIPQRHNIAFRERHRETAKQEQSSQHKYHKFFHDSVPFLLHLDLSCVFVGKVQKIPRLKASPQ